MVAGLVCPAIRCAISIVPPEFMYSVTPRAKASGILKRVCCHSFRATGVTEYMNSGGTIEIAQRIAGHTSPSTTRIYDRSGDQLTLQEIERVQMGKKQEI